METSTGHRFPVRRWMQILGTGAAALLAAGAVTSSAGAASTSNFPMAAVGDVAALSGSSMEVQSPSSGQTTVNWTPTTTFSQSATKTVSAITVGDCVTATGTASKKSKTTIAARSITLSTPNSSGACGPTGGGGGAFRFGSGSTRPPGGFQFRGGEGGGTRPSFPGGGSRAKNFAKQFANLDIASGKVTAVDGATLTVSGISISGGSFGSRSSSKSSKSSKPTKPKTETLKVTTTSSTPVSTTETVASSALAVGDCVSAFGPSASNGAVTATTVRITSTGGGSCTGAAGGGFPGGGFFGGGGGPGGGGA